MPDAAVALEPEQEIARDLARRSLVVGPVLLLLSGIFWGWGGFGSALIALAIVVGNFLLGAAVITWSVRISPQVLMMGVLGGFLVRLLVLTGVYFALRETSWFEVVPFAIALLGSHLILLIWETRQVSLSLAYPGLKPQGG